MKLNRRDLRSLIENVINETTTADVAKEYAEKNDIDTDKKAIGVYKHKGNIGSTRKFAQSRARSAGGKSGQKFELYKASDENEYGIAIMDK